MKNIRETVIRSGRLQKYVNTLKLQRTELFNVFNLVAVSVNIGEDDTCVAQACNRISRTAYNELHLTVVGDDIKSRKTVFGTDAAYIAYFGYKIPQFQLAFNELSCRLVNVVNIPDDADLIISTDRFTYR